MPGDLMPDPGPLYLVDRFGISAFVDRNPRIVGVHHQPSLRREHFGYSMRTKTGQEQGYERRSIPHGQDEHVSGAESVIAQDLLDDPAAVMANAAPGKDHIPRFAPMAHRDGYKDGGRIQHRLLDLANEGELAGVIVAAGKTVDAYRLEIARDKGRIFGRRQIIDLIEDEGDREQREDNERNRTHSPKQQHEVNLRFRVRS